jgi:hypothetical protein
VILIDYLEPFNAAPVPPKRKQSHLLFWILACPVGVALVVWLSIWIGGGM